MANIPPKLCKICGKEFIPNSCHQLYCKRNHYRTCPICNKQYVETNLGKFKRPPTACSEKCKMLRIQATSLKKYGVLAPGNNPQAREKAKKTMNDRYGVDYAQQSKTIRQKSIDTLITKYGVDNPQKNLEIKNRTQQTNINKYGSITYLNSEEGKNKINNILLNKYGTTSPLRNDEIKKKWINTNLKRYGETNPAKTKEVQEKMKQTSLDRYGTEYPISSDTVKQKVKNTFLRNYGVDNCRKSREVINKIHETFYKKYKANGPLSVPEIANRIKETNMKRYGVPYYIMLPNIAKSSGRISRINREISDKLSDHGIYNTLEYTIGFKSYDIYIPQSNILIEIDPSYTHSTIGNHWNPQGVSAKYQIDKSIFAEHHGYRCMHLWDWDCVSKFINLLTIKNIIYDEVNIEILDNIEALAFIKKYSLYDISNQTNIIYIGARYKSKLICLIGFRCSDIISKVWDIICIEHRFNYNINKGYHQMLNYFIDQYSPKKIIGYADYSKSNGEILENLGFEYNRFILPNKIWSKGHHAIIDDNSIVAEAMINDGWLPVYNCGYKVYEKNI